MDGVDLDEEVRKSHYRAIFLSDIHLGTRGCRADRHVAFLEAHTCDVIYLVGDIVDGWRLLCLWDMVTANSLPRPTASGTTKPLRGCECPASC